MSLWTTWVWRGGRGATPAYTRLPFPAVAVFKVLRQELHFVLQHLLHSAVGDALGIHQHGFPHVFDVSVCLDAALPRQRVILVCERMQILFVVAIRLACVCHSRGCSNTDECHRIRHKLQWDVCKLISVRAKKLNYKIVFKRYYILLSTTAFEDSIPDMAITC